MILEMLTIDLAMIASFERTVEKKPSACSTIEIGCKDVRRFVFRFPGEMNEDSFRFTRIVADNAFSKHMDRIPAFAYRRSLKKLEETHKGWKIYNVKKEFERMNLEVMPDQNGSKVRSV